MPDFRVMVTGANGFVGGHLIAALHRRLGSRLALLATSRFTDTAPGKPPVSALDITDAEAVAQAISAFRPTHIVNLAGLAAPKTATDNPQIAWRVHFNGTLELANAVLAHAPECSLIVVGSGLSYGATARRGMPLDETTPLAPVGAYEASKAAGDLAAGGLALQGVRTIRLRPFNHTGPGQTTDFVAPDFAMQIARIEAGARAPLIRVGNLDAERDFLDVRDVAEAYVSVVEKAAMIAPGTVLNIASGQPIRIKMVLDRLLAMSTRSDIRVEADPERMRPSETPYFVGNAAKARHILGWAPHRTLDETLADVLAFYREQCKSSIQGPA